ncbi:MAG: zeta toxin family protein [Photobacterium frigidiphilum]|uniref:nucleotide-binding protein n=1 Tax=Photobacterium frigidiphilum TaxID=264736 RepID=UPI003002803F
MAKFHFVLQGKGGVGKTFVSALLSQALMQHDDIACIDTDSVNHTFSHYKAFNVKKFDIYDNNTAGMNQSEFDNMIEYLIESDKTAVIDNGASSFIPLTHYIIENQLFDVLREMGHAVIIHTIITGGQGMADTFGGLQSLLSNTPEHVQIVVWLNRHFGEIKYNGKSFSDTAIYTKNSDRFLATIPLEFKQSQLFQNDLSHMATNKLTFEQAISQARLMSGTRLKIMRDDIFSLIDTGLEIFPELTDAE